MAVNIINEADIKLIFTFTDTGGTPTNADAVDFDFVFWTKNLAAKVVASLKNGVYTNCSLDPTDNSKLIVSLNEPKFAVGKLNCRASFYNPDNSFIDSNYKTVTDYELNINIV